MSGDLSETELARILDAAEVIEATLGRLTETRDEVDRDTYQSDIEIQEIVERRFVKMTEAALDIGTTLVTHEREEPPESNPKTMETLADIDVLSETLATEMADAARFRNVLAHTYGQSIDHDLVYDALNDLERYRDFVVEIRNYLDATGTLDSPE